MAVEGVLETKSRLVSLVQIVAELKQKQSKIHRWSWSEMCGAVTRDTGYQTSLGAEAQIEPLSCRRCCVMTKRSMALWYSIGEASFGTTVCIASSCFVLRGRRSCCDCSQW